MRAYTLFLSGHGFSIDVGRIGQSGWKKHLNGSGVTYAVPVNSLIPALVQTQADREFGWGSASTK